MDDFVQLDDGRQLAFRIIGPSTGTPLLFFHGLAQSRLTMHPDVSILAQLGIRLITIDRPGIGLSSPQRGRSLLQWPQDIHALADKLSLSKFAVVGHSAGAPYVLACAHALPERILSAAIVSGTPPPSLRLIRVVFRSKFWKLGLLLFLFPALARPVIWLGIRRMKPRAMERYERYLARFPNSDHLAMAAPAMKEMRVQSMLEAFRQGTEGLQEDISILRRQWGFDLSAIQLPIDIWHGEADDIVNVFFGLELAARLANRRLIVLPDSGHDVLFSHWTEILRGTIAGLAAGTGRAAAAQRHVMERLGLEDPCGEVRTNGAPGLRLFDGLEGRKSGMTMKIALRRT